MAEKPLTAPTPGEKKKRARKPKRTLTLWNGNDHFECPVYSRVTGYIYTQYPEIAREYAAVAMPEIEAPAVVATYEGMTNAEEKTTFFHENSVDILKWQSEVVNRIGQLRAVGGKLSPDAMLARRVYLTKAIKIILDTTHIEAEHKELIDSDIDSEFWLQQDIGGEVADFVERFRDRLG